MSAWQMTHNHLNKEAQTCFCIMIVWLWQLEMNCSPVEQLVGTTLPTKTNTNRHTCGNTFDEETHRNLNTKKDESSIRFWWYGTIGSENVLTCKCFLYFLVAPLWSNMQCKANEANMGAALIIFQTKIVWPEIRPSPLNWSWWSLIDWNHGDWTEGKNSKFHPTTK